MAVFEISGGEDDRLVRPLFAAFLPVFLALLFDTAATFAGVRAASIAVLAAASTPMLTFVARGGPSGCYADFPVACFHGASLSLLLSRRLEPKIELAAGLLRAGGMLTKHEEWPLAATALVAAVLPFPRGPRRAVSRRAVAISLVPAALAAALFLTWRTQIPARFDHNFPELVRTLATTPEPVWTALSRLARPIPACAAELFRMSLWGVFWPFAIGMLLVCRRALAHRLVPALLIALAAPLAVAGAYFVLLPEPELAVPFCWARFLVQLSFPLLVFLALAVRRAERDTRPDLR